MRISPLRSYSEQALDKPRLPYRVSTVQSFDLPVPHHVGSLDAFYRSLCRFAASHGSAFVHVVETSNENMQFIFILWLIT
jgi:hypothetical protein